MKKLLGGLAVLLLLTGCKGQDQYKIVGEYKLTELRSGDDGIDPRDILVMQAMGKVSTLSVKDDHTAVMDIYSEAFDMTWDKRHFYFDDGAKMDYDYENDVLSLSDEENTLVFEREK